MKAVIYHEFKNPPVVEHVPDPIATNNGIVIAVKATGLCRSDWHGWMGNDPISACLMCRDMNWPVSLIPLEKMFDMGSESNKKWSVNIHRPYSMSN